MQDTKTSFMLDLTSTGTEKETAKKTKEHIKFNNTIDKKLNAGKFTRIDMRSNGFILIVERQKDGKYDFLKLCSEHTLASPKIVVDYLFGETEITNLTPEVVLNLFIAKHGTMRQALKEINSRLNEKSN